MGKSIKKGRKGTAGSPPRGRALAAGGHSGGGGERKSDGTKYTRPHTYETKLKAVKLYLEEGLPSALVSKEVGVSQACVFDWARQYREKGKAGLKPKGYGHRTVNAPAAVKDKITAVKKSNPTYGSRRISQLLRRWFCMEASAETVRKTLKEQDLTVKPKKKRVRKSPKPKRFERATPNQMWQSDIFTFRIHNRNAYLIAFMDDHSRYIVSAGLYRSQTGAQVLEVYRRGVGEYGVPQEVLTDNGRQYATWRGKSRFTRELEKDGVKHIRSSPRHPQTLGKVERFWKTIWDEFLGRASFERFEEAQERVQFWVKYYNHQRPHQGIDGACPADRFFRVQKRLREVIEKGISENAEHMALHGAPKSPFYMVGRMGEKSVVIREEDGQVKMVVDGDEERGDERREQAEEKKNASAEREGESLGGAERVVGSTDDVAGVQGTVGELGSAEQLGEAGACGNEESPGAAGGAERGTGDGTEPEARETAGSDDGAGDGRSERGIELEGGGNDGEECSGGTLTPQRGGEDAGGIERVERGADGGGSAIRAGDRQFAAVAVAGPCDGRDGGGVAGPGRWPERQWAGAVDESEKAAGEESGGTGWTEREAGETAGEHPEGAGLEKGIGDEQERGREEERRGAGSPDGRTGGAGAQWAAERIGGGEASGGEPEDILQAGESCALGTGGRAERASGWSTGEGSGQRERGVEKKNPGLGSRGEGSAADDADPGHTRCPTESGGVEASEEEAEIGQWGGIRTRVEPGTRILGESGGSFSGG
jgi:transposase InsO family protein